MRKSWAVRLSVFAAIERPALTACLPQPSPHSLLRAVRRGRPAARGGAEPPPLLSPRRHDGGAVDRAPRRRRAVSPLILRARTGTSRASPSGFVFPSRTVTPSHPVASGRLGDVAPEEGAHLAAPHPRHEEQARGHRVEPAALQGRRRRTRRRGRATWARSSTGSRRVRAARRTRWLQESTREAERRDSWRWSRFCAWRAEVSRFVPDRLAEFDKLVADALNNPVPVQHSDR